MEREKDSKRERERDRKRKRETELIRIEYVGINVWLVFRIMFVNIEFLNFQTWNLIFSGQLT